MAEPRGKHASTFQDGPRRDPRRVKLLPPRPPVGAIVRRDLESRLEQSAELPLTLVIGAAGYGKTTLLSSWAHATRRRIAWLALDATDTGLRQFLTLLVASIRRAAPDSCLSLSDLLGGGLSIDPRIAAEVMADDLLELDDEIVVIIDDLHLVIDPEIGALLHELLHFPPPALRLMIASRVDLPVLEAERLRVRGRAAIISETDLQFGLEETAAALPDGALLSPADVLARTDGWAAGVRALGLVQALDGDLPQSVRDYLAADVLAGQPDDIVSLLRESAVLERITPPLAAAMCEGQFTPGDAARLLAVAERSGLFVTRLDDEGDWWKIHPLLRNVLLEELSARGEDAIRDAHARASRWFAAADMLPEAVNHALSAGMPDLAATTISSRVMDWLNSDWSGTLDWVDQLPESEVARKPTLLLARAVSLLTRANLPAALATCNEVDSLLAREPAEGWDDPDRAIGWEVLQLRASLANQGLGAGDIPLDDLRALMDGPPGASRRVQAYGLTLWGMRMIVADRWEEAREAIESVAARNHGMVDELAFHVAWTLAGFNIRQADLSRTRQWISIAQRIGIAGDHFSRSHWLENIHTTFLVETGQPGQAETIALDTIPIAPGVLLLPKHHMAMRVARIRIADGRFDLADDIIASDRRRLELAGAIHLLRDVEAVEAELAMARGDLPSAARWADMTPVEFPIDLYRTIDHPVESQARIWMRRRAIGDFERATDALEQLRDHELATHHLLGLARTLPLLAGTLAATGRESEARECMRQALAIEPGVMTARFSSAGLEAWQVLAVIARDSADPLARRANLILTAIDRPPARDAGAQTPLIPHSERVARRPARLEPEADEVIILTRRQVEIVSLLSQWKTNKEIGNLLNLSPYTVQEHVNNLIHKLGVGDRREVVSAAIAAGLWSPEQQDAPGTAHPSSMPRR